MATKKKYYKSQKSISSGDTNLSGIDTLEDSKKYLEETEQKLHTQEEFKFFSNLEQTDENSEINEANIQDLDLDLYALDFPAVFSRFKKLYKEGEFLKDFERFYTYKNRLSQLLEQIEEQAREKYLSNKENDDDVYDFQYTHSKEEKEAIKLLEKVQHEIAEERKRREREQQQNLLIKRDILDEMRKTVMDLAPEEAIKKFSELRVKWKETGPVAPSFREDIWQQYKHWNDVFTQALQINKELYELELKKNLEQKQAIINGLEKLLEFESPLKAVSFVPNYRQKWTETGPVPREVSKELFDNFKEVLNKIYERKNQHIQKLRELWQKNKENKFALIEKAQIIVSSEINSFEQFKEKSQQLNELLQEWKQIGRTAPQDSEKLWQDFTQSRKILFKKWQEARKKREAQLQKNLEKKLEIIEKAKKLLNPENWKTATLEINKLMEEWKQIGHVKKEKSETLWQNFEEILDKFYESKKAYFEEILKIQQKNLEAKIQLIEKINHFTIPEGFNYKEALDMVRNWRQEFQNLGHVPLSHKMELDTRFNNTLDKFLKRFNVDQKKIVRDQFREKISTLTESGNQEMEKLKLEAKSIKTRLEKLKFEMNQLENNLSFFQFAKNADELKKPYESKLRIVKDKIILEEEKLKTIDLALKKVASKAN